jgi:putative ABC transport system substrate-binding protein
MAALVLLISSQSAKDEGKAAPKISVIQLSKVDGSTYAGFLVEMLSLGYQQGVGIETLYKGPAGSIDKLDGLIRQHLDMKPDLILVSSTPGTQAVKRLTQGLNIPVVFAPVNDPLDSGIVPNLAHPGGMITGVRLPMGEDLRLQWLGRIAPAVKKVFVPYTQGDKSAATTLQQISVAAPQLGLEVIGQPLSADDVITGEHSVIPEQVDAIFLPRDSTMEARIDEFVALSRQRRLPLSVPSEKQVVAGALFSYGFIHFKIGGQAAQLVDQILRGTKPADLPVMMAENYLSINMKAARQMGLTLPESILRQADRLIREND